MMLFRQCLVVDRSFFCHIYDLDQNKQKVATKYFLSKQGLEKKERSNVNVKLKQRLKKHRN